MSELKPCPFCGKMPETDGKLVQCYLMPCDFRRFKMPVEAWNIRPIEDDLRKRIAELEAERRWIPVSERLPKNLELVLAVADYEIVGLTRYLAGFGRENVTHWMPLPEPPVDQPTADSTDERKDDKLSEREVCEACGGDGTLLLVDNYKGQATATVDCPYCNCTGYVKECE